MKKGGKHRRLAVAITLLIIAASAIIGFRAFLDAKYYPPILMYHSVEDSQIMGETYVFAWQFREQMKYLRDRKYNIVSVGELADMIKGGKPLPHNVVAVTFDDGNVNNYLNAFPILKEYKIPATIFMVSDYIGKPGYLIKKQIREMSKEGIEFGSHTRSHVNLKDASKQLIENEIRRSKMAIEAATRKPVTVFSFPFGEKNDYAVEVLKKNGYKAAVITMPRDGSIKIDPFGLKRIKICYSKFNIPEFAVKASGYYTWLKAKRWKKKE